MFSCHQLLDLFEESKNNFSMILIKDQLIFNQNSCQVTLKEKKVIQRISELIYFNKLKINKLN